MLDVCSSQVSSQASGSGRLEEGRGGGRREGVFGERARRRCFFDGKREWVRGEKEESKTPGVEEGGWKRRVPHLGYAQVPLYHISTQLA
jgi:hypothetical protein